MSRQLLSLQDNVRVKAQVPEALAYTYFKYDKDCGDSCDLEIVVASNSLGPLNLVVRQGMDVLPELSADDDKKNAAKNDKKHAKGKKVPVFEEYIVGTKAVTIVHDDPAYGEKKKRVSSKGTYIIGVKAMDIVSFTIVARTVPVVAESLPPVKIFEGESQTLHPG